MGIVIGWLVFSVLVGVIAEKKGRSGVGFFFLSILLSPLIGLIAAVAAKPNLKAVEAREVRSGTMKKCCYCAELVKNEATVCRYCGKDIPAAPAPAVAAPPAIPITSDSRQPPAPMSRTAKILMGLLLGGAALIGVLSRFASQGALIMLVQHGQDALRVTNDTDSTWHRCTVEVFGGYRTIIPTLKPHQTVEVSYRDFTDGSTSLLVGDASSRVGQSTHIVCGSTTARIYDK